jgi:hypothetical protein
MSRSERIIGRSCPFTFGCPAAKGQDPLSNRACRFPAHGLPVVSRDTALYEVSPEGLARVADGVSQAMQSEVVEVVFVPALRLARPEVTTLALRTKRLESSPHVRIELIETLGGIPGSEVLAPAPEDRVQVGMAGR